MQAKNNFSSSVSFNIFYLAEPNKSVTHTHTHSNNGLSLCTKAIAVRPARAPVRHVPSICKELSKLFADAFCVLKNNSRMIFIILN